MGMRESQEKRWVHWPLGRLNRGSRCHHRGISPASPWPRLPQCLCLSSHHRFFHAFPLAPSSHSTHWLRLESDLCPGEVPWLTGEARRQAAHRSQRPPLLLTTRWPQQVAPVPRVPEPARTQASPTFPAQPDSSVPLPSLGSFQVQGLSLPAWPPSIWLLQSWFGPECWTGLVYTSLCLHSALQESTRWRTTS